MTLQWTRNAYIISIIIIIIVLLSLLKGMCEVLNLGVPAKMFLFCFASRAVNKTFLQDQDQNFCFRTKTKTSEIFQDQDQALLCPCSPVARPLGRHVQ